MGGVDSSSSNPTTLSAASSGSTSVAASHIGAAKGTSPGDSTATMDADKGSPPDASLPTAKGSLTKHSTATMDAAKGSPPDASLATDVGGTLTKDSLVTDVDAAKGANHDNSLATDVDAAKGANSDDSLATDVDAAKGANPDDSLATDVDAAKGANPDDSLATNMAGNIDDSTGKLPIAATAAPSPPILDVAVAQPPKFDIMEAKVLIAKKDWQGIDDLLCKFVADSLGKDPQDAGIMHPGLLLIPREEKIIQLLQNEAFEEAVNFCEEFIKPLKKCESKFKPLSVEWRIDDLITMLNKRSVSSSERSNVDVGTSVLDYIFLYFPRAMCQDEPTHVEVEGTWQFAMKLPIQPNQVSSTGKSLKPRHGFRCLACGWTIEGTMSITGLKNHIIHSRKGKCCPNVTQDVLDRMKLIGDSKDVPDLSTIATLVKNKKRKGVSSGSTTKQYTESSPSVARTSKKLKVASPTASHTVASSPPAAAPVLVADASSHGVEKIVIEKVDILREIANFMFAEIQVSVDPAARAAFKKKAIELETVAFDLKMAAVNSRTGTSLPAQNNALAVSALSSEMLSETDKV